MFAGLSIPLLMFNCKINLILINHNDDICTCGNVYCVIFAGYKTVFVWVDVLIIVQQCLFLQAFFSIEKYN